MGNFTQDGPCYTNLLLASFAQVAFFLVVVDKDWDGCLYQEYLDGICNLQ